MIADPICTKAEQIEWTGHNLKEISDFAGSRLVIENGWITINGIQLLVGDIIRKVNNHVVLVNG